MAKHRLVIKGVGERVLIALFEPDPDDSGTYIPRGDAIRLTPEQARTVAQKLTFESMKVEDGER